MDENKENSVKDNILWDLTNPNSKYISQYESDKRFFICKGCPEFIEQNTQCKKCGCIMKNKTKVDHMRCPIGKW
jgi:hypothetical protein